MTNSANGIQREIKVKGKKLGTVTSFIYLGVLGLNQRFSQGDATAALTKLKPISRDNNSSLASKVNLMRSLVISYFCMPVNHGPFCKVREKNAGHWNEMLPENTDHFVHICYWYNNYLRGNSKKTYSYSFVINLNRCSKARFHTYLRKIVDRNELS